MTERYSIVQLVSPTQYVWVKDCHDDLQKAIDKAKATLVANSYNIVLAILKSTAPAGGPDYIVKDLNIEDLVDCDFNLAAYVKATRLRRLNNE